VLESITDRIGNDRVCNDFRPVIQGQLRSKHCRLADGTFLEDLAQILRKRPAPAPYLHVE
jgi:hypothetical protein